MQRVDEGAGEAEQHLQHAQDDGELHLVRVGEGELVRGVMPRGVDTKGVDGARLLTVHVLALVALDPGGSEEIHHVPEDIVIEQSAVDGEEAHEHEHVAAVPRVGEDLVHLAHRLEVLLARDEVGGEEGHEQAVAYVAEHDAEEEGEGDDDEGGRVDLAIPRDAVGVDDRLEGRGELVESEVRGRLLVGVDDVEDRGHLRAAAGGAAPQRRLAGLALGHGAPGLCDEALAREVVVPHVERAVDGLLLEHVRAPAVYSLRHRAQPLAAVLQGPLDDLLQLVDAALHLGEQRGALVELRGVGVPVGTEAVADLGHLLVRPLPAEEDDEDALVHKLA